LVSGGEKAYLPTETSNGFAGYGPLTRQIQTTVDAALPTEATVIVVSKGDDELLKLNGRRAWHFPRTTDGGYAGYYPQDSAAAIAHLEALRAQGGQFLLFPRTGLWWLEHYTDFRQHLDTHHRCILSDHNCVIYQLSTDSDRWQSGWQMNGKTDHHPKGRWLDRPRWRTPRAFVAAIHAKVPRPSNRSAKVSG